MSGAHKAGIVGGAVLAAGIGARSLDDCARVGARGARSMDDATARGVGLLDEPGGARIGGAAEALGGGHTAVRGSAAPAQESHWLSHAGDLGLDVALEVLPGLDESDAVAQASLTAAIKCPRAVTISRTPGAWDELMSGLGIACAPILVVGTVTTDGRSLETPGGPQSVRSLIESCGSVGAHCLVVGCAPTGAEACEQAVEATLRAVRPTGSLLAYEQALAREMLSRPGGPTLLAQRVVHGASVQLAVAHRGDETATP